MSPFAAGCAICGADLEAARARAASRRRRAPAITLPVPRGDIDWLQVVIAFVLALAFSPVGLVLALYWAQQRRNARELVMMWLMLGAAALSLAALLAPVWFWSHIYGGI